MFEAATGPDLHDDNCGCAIHTLRYEPPDLGPIVVIRQSFEQFIAEALDAVPAHALPELRLVGTSASLRPGLVAGLADCGFGPAWLRDWLVENVIFQARLYTEMTRHSTLEVRLERIDDDNCTRFHADRTVRRLVCTYRGPGTEWIDPKAVSSATTTDQIDIRHVRQAERGSIALMRGSEGASADRPALLHRSPRLDETGIVRLLLAIDAPLSS